MEIMFYILLIGSLLSNAAYAALIWHGVKSHSQRTYNEDENTAQEYDKNNKANQLIEHQKSKFNTSAFGEPQIRQKELKNITDIRQDIVSRNIIVKIQKLEDTILKCDCWIEEFEKLSEKEKLEKGKDLLVIKGLRDLANENLTNMKKVKTSEDSDREAREAGKKAKELMPIILEMLN